MAIDPRPSRADDMTADINTTPLIDVMLVLLIMLIVTIPARTDAVKLDLPEAAPPPGKPAVVRLDIAADGMMRWDGTVLRDRAALDRRIADAARRDPQPEVDLNADAQARFAYVAMALAEAQRLGITRIGILGSEKN